MRKDVARVHTVIREKELGIVAPTNGHKAEAAAGDAEATPKKAAAGKSARKKTKTAAKGKTAKPAKKKTAAKARKK